MTHSWSTCGSTDTDTTVRAMQLKDNEPACPATLLRVFPALLSTLHLWYGRADALCPGCVCTGEAGVIPMRMDSIEAMKFISEKVRHQQLGWYRAAFAALHRQCILRSTAT